MCLCVRSLNPPYLDDFVGWYKTMEKEVDMGDREVTDELAMATVEKDSVESLEERVFTVGEVV